MKCEICGKEYEKNGFGKHIYLSHNMHAKEYYDKYIKQPGEGICPVCGKETTFRGEWRYLKFCSHKCAAQNSVWDFDKFGVTKSEFYKKISDDNKEETKHRYDLKSYNRIIKILPKYKLKLLNHTNYEIFNCECSVCNEHIVLSRYRIFYNNRSNIPLCYKCYPKTPKLEEELFNYIPKIYNGKINIKDRIAIKPKELDVYLPDLKLAFEFDGTYWHADSRFYKPEDIIDKKKLTAKEVWEQDKFKEDLCISKNIKLYRIKEYDWLENNINTKEFIRRKINENSNNC